MPPIMDKYGAKEFFVAALKNKLADMGHGGQAKTARYAGVSRGLLNDILKGRSFGAEEKRRAIAAALGYGDYEAFLDIGRSLLKVPAVRVSPEPARASALSDELVELLRENRKLRREIEALKTKLETVPGGGA
jgi:transcriptional regulator with XRE-family HTH domain